MCGDLPVLESFPDPPDLLERKTKLARCKLDRAEHPKALLHRVIMLFLLVLADAVVF